MAHSKNSIITDSLNGILGKELVFRNWDGKIVVSKAPGPRTTAATAAEAKTQEQFRLASLYGKAVMKGADQGIRDAYNAALKPRQNLYSRALQDFMSRPVVESIHTSGYKGVVGNTITIRATDDFRVTGVQVEIYTASGELLEKGNAVQQVNGIDWTYRATLVNKTLTETRISAIATDVPGNQGRLQVIL